MSEYGLLPGRYPAIVKSYDQARRTCRVEIPGVTDGAEVFPEAEIEYAIGDKSAHGEYPTEVEILPGDTVWICFIGGDPRYPIITGYRNPQTGNSADWRRYHHANIELIAEKVLHEIVGKAEFTAVPEQIKINVGSTEIMLDTSQISEKADSQISLKVGQSSVVLTPGQVSIMCGGTGITVTPGGLAMTGGGSTVGVDGGGVNIKGKTINLN